MFHFVLPFSIFPAWYKIARFDFVSMHRDDDNRTTPLFHLYIGYIGAAFGEYKVQLFFKCLHNIILTRAKDVSQAW